MESRVPISSCVTLGDSPSLSFFICQMEIMAFNLEACRED